MNRLLVKLSIVVWAIVLSLNAQMTEWKKYLEQGVVNALAQQGDSVTWLGTHGGLVKVNHLTEDTTFYNRSNSNLPDDDINDLALDSKGALWVMSDQIHIAKFFEGEWTVFPLRSENVSRKEHFRNMAIDHNDKVYVAASDGLYVYDTAVTHYNYEDFGQNPGGGNVNCVKVAPDSTLWLGTSVGAVHIVDSTWTFYNPSNSDINSKYVYSICFDKNGDVWMALGADSYIVNDGGLYKFDGITWTGYDVDSLPVEGDGHISKISENAVRDLIIDSNDVKWIILDNRRLCSFNDTTWNVYTGADFPKIIDMDRFCAIDGDNNIYFQTLYGSFIGKDSTFSRIDISSSGLAAGGGDIKALLIDENNDDWWLGTAHRGLIHYDGTLWTVFDTSNSALPSNRINALAFGNNGDLWIGSNKGITRKSSDTWESWDTTCLPDDNITVLAVDSAGVLWAGIYNTGMVSYNGALWEHFTRENSDLSSDQITGLAASSDSSLWIATKGSGLDNLKDGIFQNFNSSNSELYSNQVSTVSVLDNGNNEIVIAGDLFRTSFYSQGEWKNTSIFGWGTEPLQFVSGEGDSSIWAVTEEEVRRVHYNSAENNLEFVKFYNIFNSELSSPWCSAIAIDRKGNIIIGTGGQINVILDDKTTDNQFGNMIMNNPLSLEVSYHWDAKIIKSSFTLQESKRVEISLMTLSGKLVSQKSQFLEKNSHTHFLSTEGLAKGVYFWKMKYRNMTYTKKIVLR